MSRESVEPKPVALNPVGLVGLDGGSASVLGSESDGLGAGIARRLRRGGLSVVTYAPAPASAIASALAQESGVILCESLRDMVLQIPAPRSLWLALPAGLPTRLAIDALQPVLAAGDVIVDAADGHFDDALQYSAALARQGVAYVDAGVAGAPWGESSGYAVMLGGDAAAVKKLEPALTALAVAEGKGWLHCGSSGSGHFVRMAQALMERGMMQPFSQGMEFSGNWQDATSMNPAALEKIWRHSGAVTKELQQLAEAFLAQSVPAGQLPNSAPTPAISLALSLSFAAKGANIYRQGLEALLKQRGQG